MGRAEKAGQTDRRAHTGTDTQTEEQRLGIQFFLKNRNLNTNEKEGFMHAYSKKNFLEKRTHVLIYRKAEAEEIKRENNLR